MRKKLEAQGVQRIHNIIQGRETENDSSIDGLYAMGTERTVQDWIDYTGIDYFNQVADPRSYQGLTRNAAENEIYYKVGGKNHYQNNEHIYLHNTGIKMQKSIAPVMNKLKISPMGVKKNNIINKQNGLFQLN